MITVRLATLQDTAAITAVHTSDIPVWQRFDSAGTLMPTPYESLTLYERWQHGGPWMSIETCAVHLNRLLAGAGFPLVAELDGEVLAEAEVYENHEAAPYDHHLNIAVLYTRRDYQNQGLGTALLDYIAEMARLMQCKRITVGSTDAPDFYTGYGFRHTGSGRRIRIPAQAGRAFYQASDLTDANPDQIKGWSMPLGRYSAPRQEWQALFPQNWAAGMPELTSGTIAHLKITAAGQNAIVFLKEADYDDSRPGECSVACWSSRPLNGQLLAAIRDRAHREGFTTIVTYAADADWPILMGAEAQQTEARQEFYELLL